MNKEAYNRIRAGTATVLGIIMAISVIRNTWTLALTGILLGIVVLYLAKQRVNVPLHDERTRTIREKAANTTLSMITILLALIGILLVEASLWGYAAYKETGYMLAFLANIILGVNAFFNWYYNKQLGG